MINESLIASADMEDIHLRAVLSFFALSDGAPNNFSNRYPWILHFYFGICIHGFILNAFLVNTSIVMQYELINVYIKNHVCSSHWNRIAYFYFQVWLVIYRLDFADSVKILFSVETFLRILHCGLFQPLKAAFFLYGWIPHWIIRMVRYLGQLVFKYNNANNRTEHLAEYWFGKEMICAIPVQLDLTALFGIGLFVVIYNLDR